MRNILRILLSLESPWNSLPSWVLVCQKSPGAFYLPVPSKQRTNVFRGFRLKLAIILLGTILLGIVPSSSVTVLSTRGLAGEYTRPVPGLLEIGISLEVVNLTWSSALLG